MLFWITILSCLYPQQNNLISMIAIVNDFYVFVVNVCVVNIHVVNVCYRCYCC